MFGYDMSAHNRELSGGVIVSHQSFDPGDKITVTGKSPEDAIKALLAARKLREITELQPPVIETRWC